MSGPGSSDGGTTEETAAAGTEVATVENDKRVEEGVELAKSGAASPEAESSADGRPESEGDEETAAPLRPARRHKKEQLRADLRAAEQRAGRQRRTISAVSAVLVLVVAVAIGAGVWLNAQRTEALSRADSSAGVLANLAMARKTAEDYTKKALTIDFNRAPDYVRALSEGTTQTFGETFAMNEKGAGPLIVELQQQLRMVASGDVVHSLYDGDLAHPPSAGQPWNLIVVANQTSTTAQQPDKATQVMVLKVVVVQLEGQWKVANFGPDPKSMGATSAIPGVK